MDLEQFISNIKNVRPLSGEERRHLFIVAQLGDEEKSEKAKERLREYYLPLSIKYLEKHQKTFPLLDKSFDSAFEIIEDGFVFMSSMLDEYINCLRGTFVEYFSKKLTMHMKKLQKEYLSKKEIGIFSCLEVQTKVTPYHLEYEKEDYLPLVLVELNKLSPFEKMIITRRCGLDGQTPEGYEELAINTGVSKKRIYDQYELGIKKLRKQLNYHEKGNNEICSINK